MKEQSSSQPVIEQASTFPQTQRKVRLAVMIVFAVVCCIAIGSIIWAIQTKKNTAGSVPATESEEQQGIQNQQQPTGGIDVTLPIINDLPGDLDRDGLLDTEEATFGTSDADFDTDGDGLSDQSEITIWNTDPKQVDTDGDGFGDGIEVFSGYNPNGEG